LPYSEVFIVGRDKKKLWSAIPETWNTEKKKWEIPGLYRASIITSRADIEKMIWNSQ